MDTNKKKIKKILLVEDDPAILDIYKIIMEKAGFAVDVIELGQRAINQIKDMAAGNAEKPDMVLLDLVLPDVNGMEVLKEIKKNDATKDIFVFILTNQKNGQSLESDDIKPEKIIIKADITPTQLVKIIEEQLKGR